MGALLKLILLIYFLSLLLSLFVGLVLFVIDVFRWHDKEEHVHILPSQFEADLLAAEAENQSEEVIDNDSESGEHDSPIVF